MRSAIVYATLIDAVAAAAGLLPGRAVRRVLPAAGHLLRAGGAGLDGRGADRHPGAGADPAAQGAAGAPRLAARAAGCSAATTRVLEPDRPHGRGSAYRHRRRRRRCSASSVVPAARPVAAPGVQGARLPDALGDQARHVAPGGWSASPPLASKELRAIPGVRNFGAHIGQALLGDESVGIYFGENWISVDPAVDYDETLAASRRWSTAIPGSTATCRPTSRSGSGRC